MCVQGFLENRIGVPPHQVPRRNAGPSSGPGVAPVKVAAEGGGGGGEREIGGRGVPSTLRLCSQGHRVRIGLKMPRLWPMDVFFSSQRQSVDRSALFEFHIWDASLPD